MPFDPPPAGRPSPAVRAACLVLLAAAAWFAAWLWWDWWVMDAGRADPWLTAASWSGDLLALAACGWAVATGAAWVPPDPALARRVTVGLVVGLAADLLASGATVVADHRGFERSVAVVGTAVAVEAGPRVRRGERGAVRLTVSFPTPAGPHTATTAVLIGANGRPGDLPAAAGGWAARSLRVLPGQAGPPPAVRARYDPGRPSRFWVGAQEWHDLSFGRVVLLFLPGMQLTFLLYDPLFARAFGGLTGTRTSSGVTDPANWATVGPARAGVVSLPLLIAFGTLEAGWWG